MGPAGQSGSLNCVHRLVCTPGKSADFFCKISLYILSDLFLVIIIFFFTFEIVSAKIIYFPGVVNV